MAEQLASPPHLLKARAALATMGIPTEAGEAALALAAHFFHHATHLGYSQVLHERNQTQQELEKVSEQLTKARRQVELLTQEVASLRESGLPLVPCQQRHQLRKQLRRLQRQVPELQLNLLGEAKVTDRPYVGQVLGLVLLRLLEGPPAAPVALACIGGDDPLLSPALRQLGLVGATIQRLLRALPEATDAPELDLLDVALA